MKEIKFKSVTLEEAKRRMCKQFSLAQRIKNRCKKCGSTHVYFDATGGPIVGGALVVIHQMHTTLVHGFV